jgi:propanediol dehydratase small subunit
VAELSYPLAICGRGHVRSSTGTTVAEITLDAVVSGRLGPRDVAVAADTLRLQADFAEGGGNPQLAENLRRGAELVAFDDDELLRFYESSSRSPTRSLRAAPSGAPLSSGRPARRTSGAG